MLDLRRLEILHRFSVCGSITATAVAMRYSASAISQQLSTLERETGVVLLERTARSATLTDAGRLLAQHAVAMLDAEERAESELAARSRTVAGRIVVSAIPSLAVTVAQAIASLHQQYADLDIVMHQAASEDAPLEVAGRLSDLAIVDDWAPRPAVALPGLTMRRVYVDPIFLAVPAQHPLRRTTAIGGRELADAMTTMTWLCAPAEHASRVAGDRRLNGVRAVPLRRWEFEGLDTIGQLIACGTGCGLLPGIVPAPGAHRISLRPRMVRRVYALTRESGSANPAIAACTSAIVAGLRDAQKQAATYYPA